MAAYVPYPFHGNPKAYLWSELNRIAAAIAGGGITNLSPASAAVVLTPNPILGAGTIGVSANLNAYSGGDTPSAFTLSIVDSVDAAAWRTAIGAGSGSGTVASVVAGTGIAVDNTDPANPEISLDAMLGELNDVDLSGLADGDVIVWDSSSSQWVASAGGGGSASSAPEVRGASFSGGIGAIAVPTNNVPISIREDCTITGLVVLTQGGTGSCVLDIWKHPYSTYPPTSADSICASSKPTISSGVKYQDTTFTGWNVTLSAGDTLLVNLASCSTFTAVSMFLILTPVGSTPADGYTDQRAEDAVGGILTDTATVNFTYNGVAHTIIADVITTGLDVFDSTHKGVVPASGGGTTNYLRADGTFAAPPGGGTITEGTYSPTTYLGSNVTSVSLTNAQPLRYTRSGNTVEVWGSFTVTVTTPAISTGFEITLPVASVLGYFSDLVGAGYISEATAFKLVSVNGEDHLQTHPNGALLAWYPGASGDQVINFRFIYKVLP